MTFLRARLGQLVRYAAVSVVATLTTLSLLGILVGVFDVDAGWANVIAVAAATVPSFELNRRWVWSKTGGRSVGAEVLPFWLWSFFELAVSSWMVHLVGLHATHHHWSRPLRTAAVEFTTIATTGVLWVVQFFLYDKLLFRTPVVATADTSKDATHS